MFNNMKLIIQMFNYMKNRMMKMKTSSSYSRLLPLLVVLCTQALRNRSHWVYSICCIARHEALSLDALCICLLNC
jgi:hypothetical protein